MGRVLTEEFEIKVGNNVVGETRFKRNPTVVNAWVRLGQFFVLMFGFNLFQ